MRRILALATIAAAVALFSSQSRAATTYTSLLCGAGVFNIPDASGTTPGSLSCLIPIFDPGTIGAGNQLTLSLIGLQHEASADLEVRVTHYADAALTMVLGTPQFAFSRIGKTSSDPNDFGYLPQFGDPLGTADNYFFNSGFAGDIWTAAASLGSADFIPGQAQGSGFYWTTNPFSSVANGFSSSFAGQAVAGYWLLSVTDNAEGPTPGASGSLSQFALTLESINLSAPVPEPAYSAGIALLLGAGVAGRRFRWGVKLD